MNARVLPMVAIADLVEKVETWNPATKPDETFNYVDLSAVSQTEKRIHASTPTQGADAPSRARQIIREGDILVSTVRPNLNGVARVTDDFDGATASTGFCVLRPRPQKLTSAYLMHWVRSPQFVDSMVRQATGASYPAVSDKIVKASAITLPSLYEQQRIAAILDKADALRRKRKRALDLLDGLMQSIFMEMFVQNASSDWAVVKVEDVATDMRTGPFGSQLLHSEFTSDGISVLGIDNAVANEFRWSERRFISRQKYEKLKRYTVHPGDVLITIMGTCGRCAVVPRNIPVAINTKHLCCTTLDQEKCLPEFLRATFLNDPAVQRQLGVQAKGAVMPGLNMGIIKSLRFRLPPNSIQKLYSDRIAVIKLAAYLMIAQLNRLELSFASLQHRAFSGQL